MQKIIMIVGIPHDIMLVEIRESTEQPCIFQENLTRTGSRVAFFRSTTYKEMQEENPAKQRMLIPAA